MSAQIFYNNGSSSSEIITHLVNSTDGAGLHLNGTDGRITLASPPPNLGTKFSFEFVIQADSWADSAYKYLIDFGVTGRFTIGTENTAGAKLAIQFGSTWEPFTVSPLDDLKVHHIVITVSGDTVTLYDNGNSVSTIVNAGTHNIDACTSAVIGSYYASAANLFNGTLFRTRFWNKTLKQGVYSENGVDVTYNEIRDIYESASLDFADQWGSQTNKINVAVDQYWGTNQADSGNDVNDRATFNANYNWTANVNTDISVASNLLQFSTAATTRGISKSVGLSAGKRYRVTLRTGTISGTTYNLYTNGGAYTAVAPLVASSTNEIEFIAEAGTNGYIYVGAEDATAGTIQLNAASVPNSIVEIGCVADYDLSYANPTQSNIVRNRSDAGDGTAAGGVVQITAIDQLNSRSARIGTSAATPADGELIASTLTASGTGTRIIKVESTDGGSASLELIRGAGGGDFRLRNAAGKLNLDYGTDDSTLNPNGFTVSSVGKVDATSLEVTGAVTATTLSTFSAGIAFKSAATGTGVTNTALTLDDYESGDWTPSVGGDATYSGTRYGSYTRIGRLVTATFDMTINVIGTGATNIVSGLPFATTDSIGAGGGASYYSGLALSVVSISPTVAGSTVQIRSATAASTSASNHAILTSGSRISCIVTYTA